MKVIGIDSSTRKTGISIFEDGKLLDYKLIDLSKEKEVIKRIPMMVNEVCKIIKEYAPDKIIIEETTMQLGNADTLKKLSYLVGGIMFYAYKKGIEFQMIFPSAWRKACGLEQSKKIKRTELKLESMKAVKIEYGIDVTDDVADAILVGRSAFDLPKIHITVDDIDRSKEELLD